MPEAILSRILRPPGYRVSACEADETAGTLWVWVRQTTPESYYVCGGVRDLGPGRPQLDGAAGPGSAVGHVAGLAGGRGSSRAVSPLRGTDRAATVRDGQGPLHDASGGGGGARL